MRRTLPEPRAIPNGVWGMLLLVATEAALLGTLLASYFYLQFRAPRWPPSGIPAPAVALPLALTGALVLTTVPVVAAAIAAGRSRRGAAVALIAAAAIVQAGYLAWQIVLYIGDLRDFAPDATSYGSVYFTLLGAHHAHVAAGLLLDLWVLFRLSAGLNRYRVVTVQATAVYWLFVNVFAVLVVLAQVST